MLSAWFSFVQLGCCSRTHKLLPGLACTLEDPGQEPLKPSSHVPLGTTSSPPVCWPGLHAPRKLCKEQHASPQPSLESRWLWEGVGGRTFLDKRRHGAAALQNSGCGLGHMPGLVGTGAPAGANSPAPRGGLPRMQVAYQSRGSAPGLGRLMAFLGTHPCTLCVVPRADECTPVSECPWGCSLTLR